MAAAADGGGSSSPSGASSASSALARAAKLGRVAEVERLLAGSGGEVARQKLSRGFTALDIAAKEGHLFLAELLLRHGAPIDVAAFEQLTRSRCGGGSGGAWQPESSIAPAGLARSPLRAKLFEAIDLAPFVRPEDFSDEDRRRSAEAWDESFRTIGFALVEGHGVATDLVEDLRTAAMMFFKSPSNYKHRWYRGERLTGRSGFSPIGAPNAGHTDPVEGYMFMRYASHKWMSPSETHPEELSGIGQRYCNEIEKVMHALHRMSAMALGLEENFFEPYYKDPASVLVVSHYPPLRPPPAAIPMHEGKLRYRAHSDYTGFTILLQDDNDFDDATGGGGLEVDIAGEWVPVKPKKGCFVINIGDLFETWTNDRWRSTPHRVVSPKLSSPAAARSRLTVMMFSGPSMESIIAPMSTCIDDEHPCRYQALSAAEHLKGMYSTKSKEARYKSAAGRSAAPSP